METALVLAGSLLIFTGMVHSLLGERLVFGPLAASIWPSASIDPPFLKRLLRGVWHLATIAWVAAGLGLLWATRHGHSSAALGSPYLTLTAGAVLTTGLAIWFITRGAVFAWTFFAVTGALILYAQGQAAAPGAFEAMRFALGAFSGALLWLIAALHVYWAAGGRRGLALAIPVLNDDLAFRPGARVTGLVAVALALAGALYWVGLGWNAVSVPAAWSRIGLAGLGLVFAARAVGDFRYAGMFKRVRDTSFAKLDDILYVPLCVLFAVAAMGLALPLP